MRSKGVSQCLMGSGWRDAMGVVGVAQSRVEWQVNKYKGTCVGSRVGFGGQDLVL